MKTTTPTNGTTGNTPTTPTTTPPRGADCRDLIFETTPDGATVLTKRFQADVRKQIPRGTAYNIFRQIEGPVYMEITSWVENDFVNSEEFKDLTYDRLVRIFASSILETHQLQIADRAYDRKAARQGVF